MSAVIVGSPASSSTATNAKVLRRQEYQKDIGGLETLVETYLVQSQNLLSIIPAKDTTHKAFSTASTKYSRMSVETVSTSEMDGNLTELNITFVGLTSETGLPPAVLRIIPVSGAGVFGQPINIEAKFLSDSTEAEFMSGKISSTSPLVVQNKSAYQPYAYQTRMPEFINGTKMPPNPRQPYVRSYTGGGTAWLSKGQASVTYDSYEGYTINGTQFEKRGQFLTATLTFQEFRFSYG